MAGWKELLVDVLKLTDEVKRMNRDIERVEAHILDIDRRLVRVETFAQVAKFIPGNPG